MITGNWGGGRLNSVETLGVEIWVTILVGF
jgi:hypothetical protein